MKATSKVILKLYILRISLYAVFMGALFVYSWLVNRVWQSVIILTAYTFLRWCYPTTWHHKKVLPCICYSVLIFCIATTLSLPIYTSIMSSIFVSLILTYILYKVQFLIDKAVSKEMELAELKDQMRHKDIYAMTEQELYDHCKNCGLSEEHSRIAYFVVNQRLKGNELYDAIGYSASQSKRLRKQILNKIK